MVNDISKTATYSSKMSLAILWVLFFFICLGLGYPTLNRYDPRKTGNSDSAEYYKIVEASPYEASAHWRYRVLVPYVAKPFYWLAKGRVGSWNTVFFGLLVANSMFCATSACFIVCIGYRMLKNYAVALVGAFLYLLDFNVANEQLGGLIDSGEGCLMLAVAWAMFTKRGKLLPALGILGALAKETFVPLACVFAIAWWVMNVKDKCFCFRDIVWIIGLGAVGLLTACLLRTFVDGYVVWPWDIIFSFSSEESDVHFFSNLSGSILNKGFWYIFIWLLPLGVIYLKVLPRPFVAASFVSTLTALLLGASVGAEGNVARAMFNTCGPLLSLSAANFLIRIGMRIKE